MRDDERRLEKETCANADTEGFHNASYTAEEVASASWLVLHFHITSSLITFWRLAGRPNQLFVTNHYQPHPDATNARATAKLGTSLFCHI